MPAVKTPSLYELNFDAQYSDLVCGLDEVGRGPLAGPVVAACVHIPKTANAQPFLSEIKDSKKLSAAKLEKLYTLITAHCVWGVAEVSPREIDEINILQASLLAMKNAYFNCGVAFQHALVDGNKLPQLPCKASAIVKGDAKSLSIAAASIVAKFTRDQIMRSLHRDHPHYGWHSNVGYPTKSHIAALDTHGITIHHRKSFGPVSSRIAQISSDFDSKKYA